MRGGELGRRADDGIVKVADRAVLVQVFILGEVGSLDDNERRSGRPLQVPKRSGYGRAPKRPSGRAADRLHVPKRPERYGTPLVGRRPSQRGEHGRRSHPICAVLGFEQRPGLGTWSVRA